MNMDRDMRVKKAEGETVSAPSEEKPENASGLVTVMGFDKDDVLFSSDQVGTVQWRDSSGEIVALLIRLKRDVWGFSRRGDDDWAEILKIHGNKGK